MSGRMSQARKLPSKVQYRSELIIILLKLDWELTVRPGLGQVSLPEMRCSTEIGPIGQRSAT